MLRVLTALFVCFGLSHAALAGQGALDGKIAKGQITNPKGTYDDDLIFKDNKMTSTACKKQGFAAAEYQSDADAKTFTATLKNKKGETMVWNGTISDTTVEAKGTMMDKKGKEEGEFSYTGKLTASNTTPATTKKK